MAWILIKDIRLPITEKSVSATDFALMKAIKLFGKENVGEAKIHKKSVDARRRDKVSAVYSIAVELFVEPDEATLKKENMGMVASSAFEAVIGNEPLSERPVVIGNGPAGMFCALILAENGYKPVVIEKGASVKERMSAVNDFYLTKKLDTRSNIQYGAGGAGTFSDGKLVTRINDSKCRYVLERFAKLGAPSEILTLAKPHIGTDRLTEVVENLNSEIERLGGEIMYKTSFIGFSALSDGTITAVKTDRGEIPCGAAVLATGNSGRDVYSYFLRSGMHISEKPLSVGLRIEHLRTDVETALFGKELVSKAAADAELKELLGHAEYAYSYRENDRAVYTFCMCPGGEVVCGSSDEEEIAVNGMSRYARNGVNSNCAICVSVTPEDVHSYGGTMEFCREIEKRAYRLGGGGYKAPTETVGDYLNASLKPKEPSRVLPSYMDGNVSAARLDTLFPQFVNSMIKKGIKRFSGNMKGFDADDAVLTGAETRTSAPYRILRTEDGVSPDSRNLYPCGEGAGYAGGITSSAVDGINAALKLMKKYGPYKK